MDRVMTQRTYATLLYAVPIETKNWAIRTGHFSHSPIWHVPLSAQWILSGSIPATSQTRFLKLGHISATSFQAAPINIAAAYKEPRESLHGRKPLPGSQFMAPGTTQHFFSSQRYSLCRNPPSLRVQLPPVSDYPHHWIHTISFTRTSVATLSLRNGFPALAIQGKENPLLFSSWTIRQVAISGTLPLYSFILLKDLPPTSISSTTCMAERSPSIP